MTNQDKLTLFKSIFKGRTDMYPRRWEKNEKSGGGGIWSLQDLYSLRIVLATLRAIYSDFSNPSRNA